jgi:hypothetical protein
MCRKIENLSNVMYDTEQSIDSRTISGPRPSLKRRLSLAEELAMVGEDSESAYQDETSEMASSASEDSAAESGDESLDLVSRENDSEEYNTNGESAEEEDASDGGGGHDESEQEGDGEKTLEVTDHVGRSEAVLNNSSNHARSRLPRPLQPPRR